MYVGKFIFLGQLKLNPFCTRCVASVKIRKESVIVILGNKAIVDSERCVLCECCIPACPKFTIQMIQIQFEKISTLVEALKPPINLNLMCFK